MSIGKRKREIMAFVSTLCAECTIEEAGSGHLVVLMNGPKGRKKVFTSATPSDRRGNLNDRAQMRRTAREIGCIPA